MGAGEMFKCLNVVMEYWNTGVMEGWVINL
jgi:hypothetical protein